MYSIVAGIASIEIYFVAVINPIGAAFNLVAVVNVRAGNRYINGNVEIGEADEDVEMGDVDKAVEMGEDDEDID